MRKIFFLFFFCIAGLWTACSSSDGDNVGKGHEDHDVLSSGCLDTRSGGDDYEEPEPFIVLAKEGDIVSCELHNFEYNCYVYDFSVVSDLTKASDGMDSLYVEAIRVEGPDPLDMRCLCHYNIYFAIRDVMSDEMYFLCKVPNREYFNYEGIVSFKEDSTIILHPVRAENRDGNRLFTVMGVGCSKATTAMQASSGYRKVRGRPHGSWGQALAPLPTICGNVLRYICKRE